MHPLIKRKSQRLRYGRSAPRMRNRPPLQGAWGKGKESEMVISVTSGRQWVLKPALIALHDVGDNREVFRRVRKADPARLIRRAPEHGEQLIDAQLVGIHAGIILHLLPAGHPQ